MSAAQFKVTFQQVKLGINLVEHAGCVVVSFVFPSSEALAQGVQVGDIVLDIAGVSVQSAGAPGAKDKAVGLIAQCARPVTMSFQRVAGSGASLPPGPAIAPPVPAALPPVPAAATLPASGVHDFEVQIHGASLGLQVQQHHHENMWLLVVEGLEGGGEASAQGVLEGDILKSVAGVSIHSLSQTLGMLPAEMAGNQLKQMVSALIGGSPRPLKLGFQRVGSGSSLGEAARAVISLGQPPAPIPAAVAVQPGGQQQMAEQQQELQRLQAELKAQRGALLAEKEQWQEQQQWAQEQQEQQQTQEQSSGLTFRSQPVWSHPSFSPMVANAFLPQAQPSQTSASDGAPASAGVDRGTPLQQLNWSLSLVGMMVKRLLAER
jgi:hypothetical protein